MPVPITLAPYAWTAIRLGAMAAITLYAARNRSAEPRDPRHDQALDGVAEGMAASPHRGEAESGMNGEGRIRRTFRLGPNGPGIEVDAAALGRLRLRRVG